MGQSLEKLKKTTTFDLKCEAPFGAEVNDGIAYLHQNHYRVKDHPSFKQDVKDRDRKWRFFLLAKNVEFTIWAVENEGTTYNFTKRPNLCQLPHSMIFEHLENANIRSYRFTRGHDARAETLKVSRFKLQKLKFLRNFNRYDVYWYLGTELCLTEGGLELLMAMLADKNKRSSSKDDGQTGSAEFYKDFVSVYFEILNGENEMSAEQDTASKAIFKTIVDWSNLEKEKGKKGERS